MALAGDNLFAAGTPDLLDAGDPYAALEGRKGAKLWVLSRADGEKLGEYDLKQAPVLDGLAAANGCLYISTLQGRLLCMGPQN